MINNIEIIKIGNVNRLERLKVEIVKMNLFSERNHTGNYNKILLYLNLSLNLNAQLQRSKL